MSDVQTWNVAAASNNSAAPNGFPEGMPPSGVNDAAREVMAAVARYRSDTDGVNTSSGTNTITLAASRTMTAYAQGDLYTFKAGGTNTGATTLNVDSLGAKDVQFNGAALTGGEIVSGLMYTVVYDGTQFQLLNASSFPSIDITTLEVTNIKAKDGTAAATIADSTGKITVSTELAVDNINISENTISSTNTNGNIELAPNGTGSVSVNKNTIISVADNTNAALRVTQTGTGNAILVEDATNPDATPFVVDASGNVVAGHTAVIATKGTGNAAVTPKSEVHGGTNSLSSMGLYQWSTTAANGAQLLFSKSASATVGTLSSSTADDYIGGIGWNGVDSGNTAFRTSAAITGWCDSVGANFVSGFLRFTTTNTSGTLAERMRLTANGTLDIRADNTGLTNDAPTNVLRFTDTDTGVAGNQPIGKIEFYGSDTDDTGVKAYILSSAVGVSGGGTLRFAASAEVGAATEVARVAIDGLTVTRASALLGYGAGTGGSVTQATSRTTGVTLDKTNGAITLVSAAGTTTIQSFTVTNSTVAATDTIIVNQKSGTDLYRIYVTAVAAGSFRISFATLSGTTTEQPVFNFAVIKAVAA